MRYLSVKNTDVIMDEDEEDRFFQNESFAIRIIALICYIMDIYAHVEKKLSVEDFGAWSLNRRVAPSGKYECVSEAADIYEALCKLRDILLHEANDMSVLCVKITKPLPNRNDGAVTNNNYVPSYFVYTPSAGLVLIDRQISFGGIYDCHIENYKGNFVLVNNYSDTNSSSTLCKLTSIDDNIRQLTSQNMTDVTSISDFINDLMND